MNTAMGDGFGSSANSAVTLSVLDNFPLSSPARARGNSIASQHSRRKSVQGDIDDIPHRDTAGRIIPYRSRTLTSLIPSEEEISTWSNNDVLHYLAEVCRTVDLRVIAHYNVDGSQLLDFQKSSYNLELRIPAQRELNDICKSIRYAPRLQKITEQTAKIREYLQGAQDSDFWTPTVAMKLPIPAENIVMGDSNVELDAENKFSWIPRQDFFELQKAVTGLSNRRMQDKVFVYGSKGSGKSYNMAALAVYLRWKMYKVVYIPDYQLYLRWPMRTITSAFYFAFNPNRRLQIDLLQCGKNKARISEWFAQIPLGSVYFVIDRFDGFVNDHPDCKDREEMDNRQWMLWMTSRQKRVVCVREKPDSLYSDPMKSKRYSDEERVNLCSGFTEGVMTEWWRMNGSVIPAITAEQKAEIEDLFGRLPALLKYFIDRVKENSTLARANDEESAQNDLRLWAFVRLLTTSGKVKFLVDGVKKHLHIKYNDEDEKNREKFLVQLEVCVFQNTLPEPVPFSKWMIDRRYFYFKGKRKDTGHCAAGFARDIAFLKLREWKGIENAYFSGDEWRSGIKHSTTRNMREFIIKGKILHTLATCTSLPAPMENFPEGKAMPVSFYGELRGPFLKLRWLDTGLYLFVPTEYIFKGPDALLLKVDGAAQEVVIMPVFVDLWRVSEAREILFLGELSNWESILTDSGRTLKFHFIWIGLYEKFETETRTYETGNVYELDNSFYYESSKLPVGDLDKGVPDALRRQSQFEEGKSKPSWNFFQRLRI